MYLTLIKNDVITKGGFIALINPLWLFWTAMYSFFILFILIL